MKTLYVLRHGQAARETDAITDFERELTKHGQAEVRRVAEHLLERGDLPTLVLSSSATRARQTAELCVAAWPPSTQLIKLEDLYLAGPASYLAALMARGQDHAKAMVVGHNPGLEALVAVLAQRSEHLPTAGLVEIELGVLAWSELSAAVRGVGHFVSAFRG
ncbi:MAG TPA: histidine phosphatase family protein [Polyangiaceae bacterium]|nr:histidine phosphatase family protein [Polyangiaceae bacterium]